MDNKPLGSLDVEHLFRELYPALVSYAARFSGDIQTARDLVQDTFVALWQNRDHIQVHTGVRSYMYQAVRNRALNYLRDQRKTEPLEGEESVDVDLNVGIDSSSDTPAGAGAGVDANAGANVEKMNLLKTWIRALPDRQKEAFELSRFDGLTHHEISDVMGISEKTVNNHLIAAMKGIKQMHDEYMKK